MPATTEEIAQVLDQKNHYVVLNIAKEASLQEIKRAYRQACKRFHPDKCNAPKAEEAFKRILKAFEILSDARERALYDCDGKRFYGGNKTRKEDGPISVFEFPDDFPYHLRIHFGQESIPLPDHLQHWDLETKKRVLEIYGLKIDGGIFPEEVFYPRTDWSIFPFKWAFIDWLAYSSGRFSFAEFIHKLDFTDASREDLIQCFDCYRNYMQSRYLETSDDLQFSLLISVLQPVLEKGVIKLNLQRVLSCVNGPIIDNKITDTLEHRLEFITRHEVTRLVHLKILPRDFFAKCGKYCPPQIQQEEKLFDQNFSWMRLQAGKSKKKKKEVKQKKKKFMKKLKGWSSEFDRNNMIVESWFTTKSTRESFGML